MEKLNRGMGVLGFEPLDHDNQMHVELAKKFAEKTGALGYDAVGKRFVDKSSLCRDSVVYVRRDPRDSLPKKDSDALEKRLKRCAEAFGKEAGLGSCWPNLKIFKTKEHEYRVVLLFLD